MKIRITRPLFAIPFLIGSVVSATRSVRAFSQYYGPRVTLHFSRPTFQWQVWSDTAKVTATSMKIDGTAVSATYNEKQRAIAFTPDTALAAGPHHVECKVTFDGTATFSKAWDATVASDAQGALPEPSNEQKLLLNLVNAKRRLMGLPDFVEDSRLNAAASGHTAYLCANKSTSHDEAAGSPGFIGATGGERCESFGWCRGSWEGLSFGDASQSAAVESLFNAPYHRIPFLQPGAPSLGSSYVNEKTTVIFGASDDSGWSMSPNEGATGVPVSWENHEEPSPLRGHTDSNVCGYPIVVGYFDSSTNKLQLQSATLTSADGKDVPVWINSPSTDEMLTNATIILPQKPLAPNAKYSISVKMSSGDKTLEKTWSFSTGP
jgi:uncharacterized protein YkwD